jgi:hypothetical protein
MKAFLELYTTLNIDNLHRLKEVYDDNIRFIDPAHEIVGIDNLISYFEKLYTNVQSIHFSFSEPVVDDGNGYVRWKMVFHHKRLAGGRPIHVDGVTYIEFDESDRIHYHRDYFDLGAMIYEHVTVLGRLLKYIKRGLGK